MVQPPDAAPLLAAARDLKDGGLTDTARRFAERALQNAPTGQDKTAAQNFLNRLCQ